MAATQPVTSSEVNSMVQYMEMSGGSEIPLKQNENAVHLFKIISNLNNTTWFVFRHENLNKISFQALMAAIKKDKVSNYILFQKNHDAIVAHRCLTAANGSIKCKCKHYKPLQPPMKRQGKQNLNMLTATSTIELMREIFQICLEQHDDNKGN